MDEKSPLGGCEGYGVHFDARPLLHVMQAKLTEKFPIKDTNPKDLKMKETSKVKKDEQ